MQKEEIINTNESRMRSWEKVLNEEFSTAQMVLAIGHGPNEGTPVVIFSQGLDRKRLTNVLLMALRQTSPGIYHQAMLAWTKEEKKKSRQQVAAPET